ncbi:MAG TPA: tRNA (N6-isopentenyl adenosine(37)-C2)-methylthiotransferase MiaB [Actinomycetota bacterium]|nr:tRNA (N6-isopentenyl adenosine(37)-C2)-methylthiotransferase MiaB [Actinomycetota bacterium]
MSKSKTYWIRTFGCQMNEHDSERLAGLLEVQGYRKVDSPELADVAVFNTCAIRENADNRLYGNLGHIKAVKDVNPALKVVVGGCLAEKDRDKIVRRAPWVDVVMGTRNIEALPSLLQRVEEQGIPVVEFSETLNVFPSALPARRNHRYHAWVAIQYGCNNACTFCIVPSVRGHEDSRRIGDILGEVRELCADGVTEVTLLGQNVNSYGRDVYGTPRFADLLLALDGIPGLRRVRYTSPHPKDFREPVARAMAESKVVCEHLHLPLQSGSTRVLKAMKRSYSREKYLEKVAMARRIVPGLALTTDIIVGFPGETEEDFAQTLSLVEEVRFDGAFTFKYSPRPGTVAATMEDQVPSEVVAERFDRLAQAQQRISWERNQEHLGEILEVMVEGPSKKDPSKLTGRTRTNKLVHFADRELVGAGAAQPSAGLGRLNAAIGVSSALASAPAVPGQGEFRMLEITGASPSHMEGRLVE